VRWRRIVAPGRVRHDGPPIVDDHRPGHDHHAAHDRAAHDDPVTGHHRRYVDGPVRRLG